MGLQDMLHGVLGIRAFLLKGRIISSPIYWPKRTLGCFSRRMSCLP